jgi:hypothetical protein
MSGIEYRIILRTTCFAVGIACAALIAGALIASEGFAQAPPAEPARPAFKRPAAPTQPQVAMPDAEKIVLLLRSTLVTLNDALQTGNFTVLRDMGAPGFREANTAGKLAQAFAQLASQGVDLTAVTILVPQLTEQPTIDPQHQMLRLKGFFPGQPLQINFEILYEPVAGRWRLFGLSVNAVPAAPVAAPVVAAPAAKAPAPK